MRPLSPLPYRLSVLAIGVLIAATLCAAAAPALASLGPQYGSIGQYGEVWRGGGFDASGYNNGTYGGTLTPGRFIDPVAFAVDPTPGATAVYVLDRTSNLPGLVTNGVSTWRLQKLDDKGNVLGTSQFSLPATPDPNNYGMLGLTVDPTSGRVYALVVAYDYQNTGNGYVDEILAWSTTPKAVAPPALAQLVPPTGMQADGLSRGVSGFPTPAVLSTASQLVTGGTPAIQNPQGLALDVTGGVHDLAVQGNDATPQSQGGSGIAQVSTARGAITKQWSSTVLQGLPNDVSEDLAPPAGISTAPDGSLTILLNENFGAVASGIDVVRVPADLSSTPTILSSNQNSPAPGGSFSSDAAAVFTSASPIQFPDQTGTIWATALAGPQVVGLSNGLYAGEFEPDPVGQNDPEHPSAPGDWTSVNPGMRLLQPESDGTLSNTNPPVTSIFDTLGNTAINQTSPPVAEAASACNLSDKLSASQGFGGGPFLSLAAGAGGSVWVLTRGLDSSIPGSTPAGRELIELAPGAGFPCPAPSSTSTFTVANQGGTPQPASTLTPLIVPAGGTLNVDASTIKYFGAATNAYQWDFGDHTIHSTITSVGVGGTNWPSPTTSYKYTTPGTYQLTLKLFGDFGEFDASGTIKVVSNIPPTATFSYGPAGQAAGAPMNFDASGSTPSPGASIIDYHWDWGDGTFDETPTATDNHVYAAPGTYTVHMSVLDSQYARSAAVSQPVTVVAPPIVPVPTTPLTTNPITTPTPTHTPPSRPAVTATIASTASTRGLVRVVVACHPGLACAGTVSLKTRTAVVAGAARKKHKRAAPLVLGHTDFRLAAGKSETVYIHLSVKARALLRRSHSLRVTATVTVRDQSGAPIVTAEHRTIRLAHKKATKHHK